MCKNTLKLLLILGLFQVSCQQSNTLMITSDTTSTDKIEKIEKLVATYSKYGDFNGSILVAEAGEIIYKKGFGLANMEWEIANQTDTKFRIASVSKQFTAMLIMQLVAENKLDLHTPIINYLPEYPKPNGEKITLHHLLTHTSGTPNNYASNDQLDRIPDRQKPEDLMAQFAHLQLEFSPGEKFDYSNSGYVILGVIIEKITGKPYKEALQDQIFKPLNMMNTGFDSHRAVLKNRATGYFKSWGEYYNANYIDMSSVYAAGGLYSTVEDLFLWDQALYSEKLLPQKYLDLVFTKHIPDPGYNGHYGYGWELVSKSIGKTSEQVQVIVHDGVIDGFCALITRIPSSKSSIILLSNARRGALNGITRAITGILNDKPYEFPKASIAQDFYKIILSDGIEKAMSFYKEHQDSEDYYSSEQELILAGYKLLHAGNAKDAASAFKLSTEIFPYADNPYDSYAEALMTLGKTSEAILNYEKSLSINPNNNNAVAMLKKLRNMKSSEK